ncbi:MAG: hypothetical protein ACERLG_01345 [Sedimentibacter sp.]
MKEIFLLTKVSLINNLNIHGFNPKNYKSKKDRFKPFLFIFIIVALLPSYYLYVKFVKQMGLSLLMINQELYFTALAHYSSTLIVFMFGLIYVLSYYYFSRDTDMLIPLPIKGKTIVISKFLSILIYEYLILSFFLIPILIINRSFVGGGFFYLIKATITFLLTPIIPLSLSSIIVITIMRYTNIKGKKDLIRVISMFVFLFFIIGIQIVIQKSMMSIPTGQEQEFLADLFKNSKLLIDMLGKYFPLSKWASIILSQSGLNSIFYLFITIIVNIVAFMIMVLFSEKMYLGGIIGGKEANAKKKLLTEEELKTASGEVSRDFIAIFKVDMITLLKTPIYMFNCISIVVIMPFLLLVMPALTGVSKEMLVLNDIFKANIDIFTFGLAGGFLLFTTVNPTASTSFSREGSTFWITRIIPVTSKNQIIGRSISPMILQAVTILVVSVGIRFYIPIGIPNIIIAAILGIIGAIPLILIGLFIDISRPLLNWDNPQRAVKQNMNVLISMAAGVIIIVALGALTYLMIKINLQKLLILLTDLCIFLLLSFLLYKLLLKKIKIQFAETE